MKTENSLFFGTWRAGGSKINLLQVLRGTLSTPLLPSPFPAGDGHKQCPPTPVPVFLHLAAGIEAEADADALCAHTLSPLHAQDENNPLWSCVLGFFWLFLAINSLKGPLGACKGDKMPKQESIYLSLQEQSLLTTSPCYTNIHPPEPRGWLELESSCGASWSCVLAALGMKQISAQFGEEKVKACAEQTLPSAFQDRFSPWEQGLAQWST